MTPGINQAAWGHKLWMTSFGIVISAICTPYAVYLLLAGYASPWWLVGTVMMYFVLALSISVGHHRYFCHQTFETWRPVQYLMMLGTVLVMYGSPIQWSAVHIAHHKWSDGPRDPHQVRWKSILGQYHERVPPIVLGPVKRMIRDPALRFVHRYYFLIWFVVVGSVALWSYEAALFCYLMPAFMVSTVGFVHQVTSHAGKRPHNWPWLEFLVPAVGEWYHRTHHEYPGVSRLGKYDLGGVIIELIRKDSRRSSHA